jgi:hypothetical protein
VAAKVIPVWKQVTPELEAELVAFWISNEAIAAEQDAAKRAQQVVCIARDEAGALVGASTAYPRIVPRLRQPMYYYRNFVVEGLRGQKLGWEFLEQTMATLQDFNLALPKPNCLGIIIEVENAKLAAQHNEARWPDAVPFNFIGYSPKGAPLRVWYFKGVRLPPPAQLKRPAAARARARA